VHHKRALTIVALTAGVMLAGCADDGDTTGTGSTRATSEATQQPFNDADGVRN
jgi:hypothetical protein